MGAVLFKGFIYFDIARFLQFADMGGQITHGQAQTADQENEI